MKMKTVLVLAFAIGCGLIAMMGVQQMIAQQGNQKEEVPVQVLVAKVDISPGVLLNELNCEFRELSTKGLPSDAVRSREQYSERGLLVPVMAGDIIRATKLGARGDIAASASIPAGMRTVSIQVNDTKTHSGLLQPGDRIDLQVTYEVRNADGMRLTKSSTMLEFIEVFASDAFRNMEAGESKEIKAKNITLLVTPEQANYIQLANKRGELTPIMRSRTDKTLLFPDGLDELVLTELRTGMVQDRAELDKDKKLVQAEPDQSQQFQDFLNKMAVTPEPEPVVTPNQDSWTITIYAGDNVITHDVLLPAALRAEQGKPNGQNQKSTTAAAPSNSFPQKSGTEMPSSSSATLGPGTGNLSESMKKNLQELFEAFKPTREPEVPYEEEKPDSRTGDTDGAEARRETNSFHVVI